jgi:IS30 family transposase
MGRQPILSEDDKDEIVRLYTDENMSAYAIGKLYGRKQASILNVLNDRGVTLRRGRPKKEGPPPPREPMRRLYAQEKDQIVEKFNAGVSIGVIAQEFRRRIATIENVLKERGIEVQK